MSFVNIQHNSNLSCCVILRHSILTTVVNVSTMPAKGWYASKENCFDVCML